MDGTGVAREPDTGVSREPVPHRRPRPAVLGAGTRLLVAVAGVPLILLAWWLVSRGYPVYVLPGPGAVWNRFIQSLADGTYLPALGVTAEEALLGWIAALVVGLPLGYVIGSIRSLEDALAPYLAGSQSMPIVAIAPLLIVWVGLGLPPKVIVCALISFFPVVATTASGVRGVPRDLRDAAQVFGAGRLALIRYVDAPLAARTVFAGLKVGATLAITGAVVGEFVSADQGLGYLILFGQTNLDTPLMFVALLSLVCLGAVTYAGVSLIERFVLRWEV